MSTVDTGSLFFRHKGDSKYTIEYYENIDGEVVLRRCTKCMDFKELSNFNRKSNGFLGRRAQCKSCVSTRKTLKVEVTEIKGIKGKICLKCKEWTPLNEFRKCGSGLGGRRSKCSDCLRKPKRHAEVVIIAGEECKKCSKCNQTKNLNEFHKNRRGVGGRIATCKKCISAINKKKYWSNREIILKNYQENKEKIKKYKNKWKTNNKDKLLAYKHRRRSLEKGMESEFSDVDYRSIMERFDNKCCLTGEDLNLHLDHVIPICLGRSGSERGNIVPLTEKLNLSKNNRCIFDWFDANKERFNLSQQKFDELIEYLAELNGMTTQEYEDYVRWCHDNPRTIEEIKAEKQAD